MSAQSMITIYTDGGCNHNPGGRGGYGVVVTDKNGNISSEYSEGYESTTNNRMEIMAILKALDISTFMKEPVKIVSDSQYAIKCATGEWNRNANEDLWEQYDKLAKNRKIKYKWVKGHSGNRYNERCDELATLAMNKADKKRDMGYTQHRPHSNTHLTKSKKEPAAYNAMGRQIEVNPFLNERRNVTDPQEYMKQYHVNESCAKAIITFYKEEKHSFKSYRQLKTGGIDYWSNKYSNELKDHIGKEKAAAVFANIKDIKMEISCMKWICRGLSVTDAIRKVMVDKEIQLNANK